MKWRWFYLPLMLSTLPSFLVYLLVVVLIYKPEKWRWSDGCIEFVASLKDDGDTRIWGEPEGQTFGCPLIGYASERSWNYRPYRLHERVHVIHSAIVSTIGVALSLILVWLGGWFWVGAVALWFLFGITYGAHYAWGRLRGLKHDKAYRRIWTERVAYRLDAPYRLGGVRDNDPEGGEVWGS